MQKWTPKEETADTLAEVLKIIFSEVVSAQDAAEKAGADTTPIKTWIRLVGDWDMHIVCSKPGVDPFRSDVAGTSIAENNP